MNDMTHAVLFNVNTQSENNMHACQCAAACIASRIHRYCLPIVLLGPVMAVMPVQGLCLDQAP